MKIALLCIVAVTLACLSLFSVDFSAKNPSITQNGQVAVKELHTLLTTGQLSTSMSLKPLHEIEQMLHSEANLSPAVIDKVRNTIQCARQQNVDSNNILVVIDYSMPSSEKRLWVFDLAEKKLLFNTYVSHGIRSGALLSTYFSNKYNSKSSSIGVYKTEKVYYGRHGLSLKLRGLERGFNDNAENRSVVMHGGWYVEEDFIKRYGRAGRSWGCPAIPDNLTTPLINTIKDSSLFVVYYPNENWLATSRFLNCEHAVHPVISEVTESLPNEDNRDYVLFADLSKHKKIDDTPIVAMSADNYERIFQNKAPLERMLRRQIDKTEYIALSAQEFNNIIDPQKQDDLNAVCFIVPVVKMDRGYYGTEMKILNMGAITNVKPEGAHYTVYFANKSPVNLSATNQFIRWLGL